MGFFDRLSNGWKISMSSFKVLNANKQLVIFPILSSISLLVVIGSFFTAIYAASGWNFDNLEGTSPAVNYLVMFLFYIFNYFIIVFFNMALVHCTHLYFKGEEVTIRKGLEFSMSRIGVIFSWAVFAATVGTILKAIQESSGALGKIIVGIIGIVWSVATFFVVPVMAYEKLGPIDAFKRSSQLMKQKWGESLGATFSFGIIQILAIFLIAIPLFFIGSFFIHPLVGIALAVCGIFIIISILSAAQTIFISAVYHDINGDPTDHFNRQMIDNLFEKK
ncbi:MAG: DUF6159 family protein [Bacteroidota bacterium]